jgi:N utilization substance protein B
MATYCLRYVPDIPRQVTIDEAVELAKEFSGADAFRFINGVLDAIARDQSVTQV